ncbi:14340_t:CDS:2, partial [Funneliformis geosporum]
VVHPMKEMVSGVNLPAQLQIAMGIPLYPLYQIHMLISDENLTAERPDKMLAVICGAVTKAYTAAMESIMEH